MSLKFILIVVFSWLAFMYAACLFLLVFFHEKFLYFPTRANLETTQKQAEENGLIPWKNTQGEIIGWKSELDTPAERRMLIFHGNGGMAAERGYFVEGIRNLPFGSWDVYVMEYPGYGAREGIPTQDSIIRAGVEALKTLREEDERPVFLFGESLGCAVSAQVAANTPSAVAGMVMITPFNTLGDVAVCHYPIFPMLPLLFRGKYGSEKALERYDGKLAVVVLEGDTVTPMKLGEKLFQTYRGTKKKWVMRGVGHGYVGSSKEEFWWPEVFDFLMDENTLK